MMTDSDSPLLSIIIPAYNEEDRLPHSLQSIAAFVDAQPYAVELIVVNNNSTDQTAGIAEQFAAGHPYARVLHVTRQGKGAAVQVGMMEGRGDYLFICDADLSMPIEEVNKFLPPQVEGFDVVIGSREAPGSRRIDEPEYRHVMGRVFNLLVRVMAIPRIQDTQCGFKAFKRQAARDIFSLQTIQGWGFDVEVLYIAIKRGYRLTEVPITWYYIPGSKIKPVRDTLRMINDLLRVRWNGWRGLYSEASKP